MRLAFILLFGLTANMAIADVGLSNAVRLGSASFRWLGVNIYDATLYTQSARGFSWNNPLALELIYKTGVSGKKLAGSAVIEISRLEGKPADHQEFMAKLRSCFRDVKTGDRYVAVSPAKNRVNLSLNGRRTCSVNHPGARERFLGIWLSPKSRAPKLSRRLRGE
ncbi:hypothetical protein GG681_15590 [Epibacterium sp. SM1969]|uniref:Chalcone isomerase domain-containing protein n=1 Tax=Tritonibacter aquimaris TaxID=2663379 RepID=A0A844AW09_9RHOB|nr:hypothetical protein [Tritonibacter aquimaris]MQY44067.1 hypothetical protein [Tritonibacter aquimaris]